MYNYDTLCTALKHTNQAITNITSVEIILCKTKKVLVLRNKKIVKIQNISIFMVCIKKSLLISLPSPQMGKTGCTGKNGIFTKKKNNLKMSILCQNHIFFRKCHRFFS